jgi:hypothetical protein
MVCDREYALGVIRTSSVRFLTALNCISQFRHPPAILSDRNGRRDSYSKLVFWQPGLKRQKAIYLGRLNVPETEILTETIRRCWPRDELRTLEKRIRELHTRRKAVFALLKEIAVKRGYNVRGYKLHYRRRHE